MERERVSCALEGARMDAQRRELARRLFVTATELFEDAHEIALAGQSPHLSVHACRKSAERLRAVACDLAALADVVSLMARVAKAKPI